MVERRKNKNKKKNLGGKNFPNESPASDTKQYQDITLTVECEIMTLAGRRVFVKLSYYPGDRKFKSVGPKMR